MYNIVLDDKNIDLKIINKRRNKNITLTVKNGQVIIVKPYSTNMITVKNIILENKVKILEYINNTESKINFKDGDELLYLGKKYILRIYINKYNKEKIVVEDRFISVYTGNNFINSEEIKEIYKSLLKNTSKDILDKRLKEISNSININYTSYKIRYMTTRWGSCISNNKTLNFNTKIAMLPLKVIDSIIIHELCHIIEPNHKKEFWNLVYKYMPDYDKYDKWLKNNADLINI